MAITQIETFDVNYPVAGHFKFFQRPRGRPAGRPTVVVKITDEGGTVGWGQSVPSPRWSYETPESVRSTIETYLAPELIGRDPQDLEALHALMNREIAGSFSIGQPLAKAALDVALHDLAGKLAGQSLAARWGRASRSTVQLSWTINPQSLDEVPEQVARARSLGYRSFNVKIAPDVASDLQLCRHVRELAPDAFIWADANGGYQEADALAILPWLADLGFAALEQPLPANRLTGYRRLMRQRALPILMDEGIVSHVELEEFISLELLDGVAMKVARCGGLLEAVRMMKVIEDHGLMFFGSGLTDPDISLAASVAFFGAFELAHPAALNAPQFLTTSILQNPLELSNGSLTVASGPGLGIEVDETRLQ